MAGKLSVENVRRLRLRAQRLQPRSGSGTAQLVHELCGLQAQELPAALLSVRVRSRNLVAEDIRRAREQDRSIVLTWWLRGTLHLAAAEDLGWLLPFLGPPFIRRGERRYRQLGLDAGIRSSAVRMMRDVLSSRGPLTRPELASHLGAKGIPVEGQAIAHLVGCAALEGVICFGPERDGDLTYVTLQDWLQPQAQPPREPEFVQAELARRYLEAYGPAVPRDLAAWAGLPAGQARAGFAAISGDLIDVELDGGPAWMLKRHAAWLDEIRDDHSVRLLPRFDTFLLGYQSRSFMASDRAEKRIHPGGGQIHAVLLVNGRAAGTWRFERKKHLTTIVVAPFEPLEASDLMAEVDDIGRFLGQQTALRVDNP